ncbi:MAG: ParA family protein [Parcubacteria group bacterium]|nr:ParA family protein [Parcubacteria group bacterium]
MGKTISLINQKGGTGKTTTVINLARAMHLEGKKILVIDMDPQGNASSGLGAEKNISVYEIISDQLNPLEHCATIKDGLCVLPANENLAGANVEFINLENREFLLSESIKPLHDHFDFILIDSPPSLSILTVNALAASDYFLVPVQAEYFALEGLGQLLSTINLIQQNLKPDLRNLGALVTMYDERARLSKEVLENLYKNFDAYVFRTIIPRNIKLAEAPSFGKSIFDYAPSSRGATAYRRLAKELLFRIP